ncbi:esterase [Asanoa ferruginea]|nr:esterase [Asanoa ferruginea]
MGVPLGYLIGIVVVGVGVWFALAPPRRPRPLREVGFRYGLVVNEVPFLFAYGLLASFVLALVDGDLTGPGGWLTAGLTALPLAGLGVLVARATTTPGTVDAALEEAIGVRPRHRNRLARILLAPFPGNHAIERIGNLSYGDHALNRLDVYRHRSRPTGGPVLVFLHGGGYFSGSKRREGKPLLHRLAGQGWVCISADYRLRPSAGWPDHLVDAKKVIAWAREHAAEYGGDPNQIYMAGSSAGGHLSAICALTPNAPEFQPGFESVDTTIEAAIPLYGWLGGYYDDPPIMSTPMDYANPDAPPFFVVHGERDSLVPVQMARDFVADLREVSASPVAYAELRGAQHVFDMFHSLRNEAVIDGIEAFTTWVRSRRDAPTMTR